MSTRTLDGQTFTRLIKSGAANLKANAGIVNELNVFPIPDGDTGENMSLTIGGGLRYLEDDSENSVEKTSGLLADGMLLSARGNSGVILSQLFAGIAKGLNGKDTATVSEVAEALKEGVKNAYSAVINPTEGTILTVAREAAEYAAARITPESTLESFGEDYLSELNASLDRTPELLSVLKEAGVVDSGGAGLYYIVEGIMRTFKGENMPELQGEAETAGSPSHSIDLSGFDENSVMTYGYCTEFLLQLQNVKTDPATFSIDELTEYLESVGGDSIVAFKNGTVVKVHVHTMNPGRILEHCQNYGEFLTVKIENMTLQHHETVVRNRFSVPNGKKGDGAKTDANKDTKKAFALVTVASGDGIKKAIEKLGADYVINGGQCKNPAAEDFIKAFESVNAKTVFVLPNNGNIILAAHQAAQLYKESDVRVIESKNIGDGYAALTMLSYDSGDADTIAEELTDAMKGVITGTVTQAVRDASLNGINIHENDYIGFTGKNMLAAAKNKNDAALALLEKLEAGNHEFMIALYGAAMEASEKENFRARVREKYPRTELYETDGGQDVYDYILILQ